MPEQYEIRQSNKTECRHCIKFLKSKHSEHIEKYDTTLNSWVSVCNRCGMTTKVTEPGK